MKSSLLRRALAAGAAGMAAVAVTAAPALASGGSGGGGGIDSGGPCVQVNSLSPGSDQSVATEGAWISASYTVSRCGGNNPSFTVLLTADDPAGNRVLSFADTWYPTKSLPFSATHETNSASFGTSYRVTLSVIVPETGTVVVSAARSVTTPAARAATCATATNLGGTAGYYPGMTTAGALWLSYTVKNCGGRDWFDTRFSVTNLSTGQVVYDYPNSVIMGGNTTTGIGLVDVEPVPTSTPYEVRIEVRHHGDGQLYDNRSLLLTTPASK